MSYLNTKICTLKNLTYFVTSVKGKSQRIKNLLSNQFQKIEQFYQFKDFHDTKKQISVKYYDGKLHT